MRVPERSRLDAKVDDEVDVVRGANVGRLALHLVEEHHLAADQQPVAAELWRNLDERAPRLCLAADQRW
jgi:hypothetical protein